MNARIEKPFDFISGNLHDGTADLVLNFAMLLERFSYVDFLPSMHSAYVGIFIPKIEEIGVIDWNLLRYSFDTNVWIAIASHATFFGIVVYVLTILYEKKYQVQIHINFLPYAYSHTTFSYYYSSP